MVVGAPSRASLLELRLEGEIPASFGNLVELRVLNLGNNLLTGTIPPELGQCQSELLSSSKVTPLVK